MRNSMNRTGKPMNRQVIDKPYKRLWKNIKKDRYLLVLVAPVIIYYFIFNYIPMYGAIIAFKDFSPGDSILFSKWVGLKWFREFFRSVYFTALAIPLS